MTKKRISDEEKIKEIKNNVTIKGVLDSLGMAIVGGNYDTIRRCIKKNNINIEHFKSQKQKERSSTNTKLSYEKIFTSDSNYTRSRLKNLIIKNKLLVYECAICKTIEWQGKKLSLHLDHINGIRNDNRIENLRFLCPNCHSLTETYCGKANKFPAKLCLDCNEELKYRNNTRCARCEKLRDKKKKIVWPSLESLTEMIEKFSYVEIGRQLGVSDNAVRKHINRLQTCQ